MLDHPILFESTTLLNSAAELADLSPTRCSDEDEPKLKTFAVTIKRQVSQVTDFEIQAANIDEARELAEVEISNVDDGDWDIVKAEEPEVAKVVELSDGDEPEEASGDEEEEARTENS